MRKTTKNRGRTVLAATAVGVAVAGAALFSATAANAATGTSNQGIRNMLVTPTSPATSFAVPGTTGTVSWNNGDGTAAGTLNLAAGDSNAVKVTLPQGMAFAANACAGYPHNNGNNVVDCSISADGRTLTSNRSWTAAATDTLDYNNANSAFPVVSTGIITGQVSGTYTPYVGITTQTPATTATVPGAGTFALTGGSASPDANGDYTVNGTAQPGASIVIKDVNGATVGTATADSSGNWTANVPQNSAVPLTVTQSVGSDTSAPLTITALPLPVMNGVIAAGAVALAGLGFGGVALYRRRSRVTA